MAELVITEKPLAAQKIATALSEGKLEKKSEKGVPYYEINHKGKEILVASAVGHIFILSEKIKSNTYPVSEVEWKPSYLASKNSSFTKKYYDVLKKLSKQANEFTVATDYDIEGSVIGANIVKYICNKKDAKRMKFSTLTKDELIKSYETASKHLDFPQIEAGETRHELDFLWGISTSRALTNSIKNATGRYKIMSTGRVQGPTLKIIVDKELEIKKFIPVPYWQLQLLGNIKSKTLEFFHEKNRFDNEKEAKDIYEKIKGNDGKVHEIKKDKTSIKPPSPFDLTSLQIEAYRTLRIQPKNTLEIAQNLYLTGLISYPRTNSQQLPESLNYKEIISKLSKQTEYKDICKNLLSLKELKPNNGKKTDKAHPAIHPTGEIPEKLTQEAQNLYDLIVRRTLASFSSQAIREIINLKIDVKKEIFVTNGSRTETFGWLAVYGKFNPYKDEEIPETKKDDLVKVIELNLLSKETQPPKRYTPASIIKKLEQLGLGTKSTRSSIVETLFDRNYVNNESIEATSLGIKTIETLEKYCVEIVDEKLTRHFEEEMEQIQDEKKKREDVIEEAKKVLIKMFKHFKENEDKIGKSLYEANQETLSTQTIVGKCYDCEGSLKINYSKKNKSYFISCNKYPDCKAIFSIPKYALPKPSGKFCGECKYPVIKMIRKGKRPYEFCINKNCKKKLEYQESLNN
ncbi:DNA topoisomerase I [Candidatus Woesearchaeota archaeon]|nr:DNA topoisomerase I [Candidatus Woesearchaeota archaeon]